MNPWVQLLAVLGAAALGGVLAWVLGLLIRALIRAFVRIWRQPPRRWRPIHTTPHLNEEGGCLCRCIQCVRIHLSEGLSSVRIAEVCCCRQCSQECPPGKMKSVNARKSDWSTS